MRTFGPATATSLFAVSHTHNLLGGNLVYVLLILLSIGGVAAVSRLPSEAWDMDDEDEQSS
jgi:hypothetical protein